VTGGAGCLALASARALLEHGVSGLGLLDLTSSFGEPGAKTAILALRSDFPQAKIITTGVDVTDAEGMKNSARDMRDQLGPLNILCCFAGVVNCVEAEKMTVDEWRRVQDVNTTGTWLAAQAVGKWVFSLIFKIGSFFF
jgi:NAD(P)-dependent dehydrogenase (short-subunit alcohol dehydrogenase family)